MLRKMNGEKQTIFPPHFIETTEIFTKMLKKLPKLTIKIVFSKNA